MDKDKDILTKSKISDGMTVPEGYFAEFTKRMVESLPQQEQAPQMPRTTWQRIRPYVYMAAMFLGVWCMLKMFTLMSSGGTQPLESNPVMAEAFGNETFVNDYVISDLNQWDIYDEMMEDGIDPESLCDSLAFDDQTYLENE